jgi:DNA-binding transcriptional regulator YdaS (Cro superfamily)
MELKTFIQTSRRGTAKRLAEQMGISASYLSQVSAKENLRTPEMCVQIETLTLGAVPRQHLRTNWREVWPELSALPADKDAA